MFKPMKATPMLSAPRGAFPRSPATYPFTAPLPLGGDGVMAGRRACRARGGSRGARLVPQPVDEFILSARHESDTGADRPARYRHAEHIPPRLRDKGCPDYGVPPPDPGVTFPTDPLPLLGLFRTSPASGVHVARAFLRLFPFPIGPPSFA
jgi:hypothetical protein